MYKAEQFLEGYKRADARVRRIESELRDLERDIDALGGQSDGQPRATVVRSRTEDMAIKLADKRIKLVDARMKAIDERAEVFEMIQSVEGTVEADVLYYRYIKNYDWEDIAELVMYSRYWTQVIWRRGLSMVEEILRGR